jgi:hypothetical protein
MNTKVSAACKIAKNTFRKYVEFAFMILYISVVSESNLYTNKDHGPCHTSGS